MSVAACKRETVKIISFSILLPNAEVFAETPESLAVRLIKIKIKNQNQRGKW